jgi:hypothetical protein
LFIGKKLPFQLQIELTRKGNKKETENKLEKGADETHLAHSI